MAYILVLKGYSKTDGKESLHIEPTWWRNQEMYNDPRLKEIVDGGFLDYEAKLSVEEARQMHEHFKPLAADKYNTEEGWQRIAQPRLEALDSAFYEQTDEFSHFVVGLYDFSSGM